MKSKIEKLPIRPEGEIILYDIVTVNLRPKYLSKSAELYSTKRKL